jgi:hypothetical protein
LENFGRHNNQTPVFNPGPKLVDPRLQMCVEKSETGSVNLYFSFLLPLARNFLWATLGIGARAADAKAVIIRRLKRALYGDTPDNTRRRPSLSGATRRSRGFEEN